VGENFAKAFATIGERGFVSVGIGKGLADGGGGGMAGRMRAQGMLEFVEGEEDAHGVNYELRMRNYELNSEC